MGQRYACIFGVDTFVDSAIPQLVTPPQNVHDIATLLKNPEIGYFDDVQTLPSTSSRDDIEQGIEKLFENKKSDDLLLLYFSGHGLLDRRGRLYFPVHETESASLQRTAIPASFILDYIDDCAAQQIVLLLDCCFSAAFDRGHTGSTTGTVEDALKSSGSGRVVLTASNTTSHAWEGDQFVGDAEHSVFTSFLIDGLTTGDADENQAGIITVDDMFKYISERARQSGSIPSRSML